MRRSIQTKRRQRPVSDAPHTIPQQPTQNAFLTVSIESDRLVSDEFVSGGAGTALGQLASTKVQEVLEILGWTLSS